MISSFLAPVVQRNVVAADTASSVTSASVIHVMQSTSRPPGTQQPSGCCSARLCATRIWGPEGRPLRGTAGCQQQHWNGDKAWLSPAAGDRRAHTRRQTHVRTLPLPRAISCKTEE